MPQKIMQSLLPALMLVSSGAIAGDILIDLDGRRDNAPIYLALVAADQPDWDGQILRQAQGDGDELRLRDVPPGRYAVQLFQDLDGDGALALSPRGIPQEPVGFSNNPSLLRGKPTPARCRFEHGSDDSLIEIRLHAPRRKATVQAAS